VGNSPAAVFLFISHSTILISQQKTHLRWAIRLPHFFIYISLDNIDFATKKHICGGQFACRSFLFISHSTILISQQKTHLRWAIEFHNLYTDSA